MAAVVRAKKVLHSAGCCCAGILLALQAVQAQAQPPAGNGPPAGSGPPAERTANPMALPGDVSGSNHEQQLHVPLGPPPGTKPSAALPTDTTPGPPLNLAVEAAQAAVKACAADGYPVGVAVTDAAGHLKAGLSADGVPPSRVYIAIRKDITVVTYGQATLALREKFSADPSLLAQVKPNMSLLPGGIPIKVGDRLLGAIATSGAEAYEEEKCDRVGLEKIQRRLK
jgi:uncharacterized protein GlcG (DUF336 family)